MSFSKNSKAKMAKLDDKDLTRIIENGTLLHAAARAELKPRGLSHLAAATDQKFISTHEV
jgi:hypothetical protein